MPARSVERGPQRAVTSLVFPAYNPGPRIARTWQAVRDFLAHAPGAWEILFVCDGCTDGTPERLARLIGPDVPQVRVLSYPANRGKGHAVRHGLLAATGAWRLFTDVDLAYGFDDVVRVARTLQGGAAVAIASRWHPDSRMLLPPALQWYALRRRLQSQFFSSLARWLLPLTQRDTQAGLKGLSAGAARLLLPHLRCDGFEFDCELLTACARLEVPVVEVPVCVRCEDQASTTSGRAVLHMVRELVKIRRDWRQLPAGLRLAAVAAAPPAAWDAGPWPLLTKEAS